MKTQIFQILLVIVMTCWITLRKGMHVKIVVDVIIIQAMPLSTVSSVSCQVYPSEYAYRDDSVSRAESASANCRMYSELGLSAGLYTSNYVHCDGTKLKLADSNLGRKQYSITDSYQWSAGSDEQLLFIFPTRVSLTTITLHYYSDSHRGLPRLRFYAVPDDSHVWDAPITSYPYVDVAAVPPGGEPAGRRNVSININFNARKILMYKLSSTFQFAVSEVEFVEYEITSKYMHPLHITAHHNYDLRMLYEQLLRLLPCQPCEKFLQQKTVRIIISPL